MDLRGKEISQDLIRKLCGESKNQLQIIIIMSKIVAVMQNIIKRLQNKGNSQNQTKIGGVSLFMDLESLDNREKNEVKI